MLKITTPTYLKVLIIALFVSATLLGCSEDNENCKTGDCKDKEEEELVLCGEPSSSRMAVFEKGTAAEQFGFVEYLPCDYSSTKNSGYSLIMYHPGLGEVGNGSVAAMEKMLKNGPPKLINSDNWPPESELLESPISDQTIVIAPQFDQAVWGGYSCPTPEFMQITLQYAIDNYNVDPDRVYMIGVSCGVWGIRDFCISNPDCTFNGTKVAGIIVISGNFEMESSRYCSELVNQPLWLFHGESDGGSTPPTGSTNPYSSLKKCDDFDSQVTKLTTFPSLGHSGEVWDKVLNLDDERLQQILDDEGIDPYTWLYSQKSD